MKHAVQQPRILAIDDTPANLQVLAAALTLDFNLQIATSGAIGLAAAAKAPPDLILLDVMMPVMDGFEFLRELRARPEGRMIPVVVVTAKELTAAERDMLRSCVENIVQMGALAPEEILAEIRAKMLPAEGPAKAV